MSKQTHVSHVTDHQYLHESLRQTYYFLSCKYVLSELLCHLAVQLISASFIYV